MDSISEQNFEAIKEVLNKQGQINNALSTKIDSLEKTNSQLVQQVNNLQQTVNVLNALSKGSGPTK